MVSSLSATSNERATSPSSVSCTSLATTDIFALVHRGVGDRVDYAAVNGAESPRARLKSLWKNFGGDEAFWHHEVFARSLSFVPRSSHVFPAKTPRARPPTTGVRISAPAIRGFCRLFSFSAPPSRRLDRRAQHNSTARHHVDERSHGAQKRPDRLDSLAKGKTKHTPAPNGDARLANDAAIGSRTSGRRSTPRFSHVKRRPARRDERPRAFVRAPRRRSVASPSRAPCSARRAPRRRPRARPIGRSVGRPLTPRCRGSTRSRSEARRRSARR